MFFRETTLISYGDFLDVYHKLKQKRLRKLFAVFSLKPNKRVSGKWDTYKTSSDFWIIPELIRYWNKKISGDAAIEYEAYVSKKYLSEKRGLRLLSVGCGEGVHERNFAKQSRFSEIIGVDLSEKRIQTASKQAREKKLPISYFSEDFRTLNFQKASFDVILFNASLHHFDKIAFFLKNDIKPLLKNDGILVINEYSGPNRLQWTNQQLEAANKLLKTLPKKYKILIDGKTEKKKVYRPGLLRMLMVDPSEAPDSKNLLSALHQNFEILEETKLGGNLLHCLLKGIAHNFLSPNIETKEILERLIATEETFVDKENTSDNIFGVYKKP